MSISILFMGSKQGLRIELVWLGVAILVQTNHIGINMVRKHGTHIRIDLYLL